MHVKKNACEKVIQTICGKKENKEVGQNLEVQNLHLHVWVTHNPQNPLQWMMLHVNCVLNERELSTFQSRFTSIKVPSEYYWKQLENKQEMKDSRFMKWNNCIN
jgi:hypothetical protein